MINTTRIRSENDLFQTLAALRTNRVKRNKRREFLFEGVRNINNALRYGWDVRGWLFAPERPMSDWARGVLTDTSVPRYELPVDLLAKLSAKDEVSELLALAAIPPDDLARIPARPCPLLLVFDRPASPGNLGTLIRSCDALGVDGLVVTGHAVDVYDPATLSAATGSLFALPVVRVPSHRELEPWLAALRGQFPQLQVVGTDEGAPVALGAADFRRPTLLLAGNEARGLSAAYQTLCDQLVRIPMQGSASSLNVACASSIVLYEIQRQRFASAATPARSAV